MRSSFEYVSEWTGEHIRIEATYISKEPEDDVDEDVFRYSLGKKPGPVVEELALYIENLKVDSCLYPTLWRLSEFNVIPGCRRIWGLKLFFKDMDRAAEYDAWIESVIADRPTPVPRLTIRPPVIEPESPRTNTAEKSKQAEDSDCRQQNRQQDGSE